jgi:hypothetical protein
MSLLTALELMNLIEDELGLSRSSTVTSTSNVQTRQILAFMNATVEEVAAGYELAEMERIGVIEFGSPTVMSATTVAGSGIVTVASSAAITPPTYWVASGGGIGQAAVIQNDTRVVSTPSGTTILLDKTATASGVIDITFTKDTFSLPSDYKRMIPQTAWDSRFQWQLIGPMSPQLDRWQRSGIVGPFPRRQMRLTGRPKGFRIFPAPTASGQVPGTLIYEYMASTPVFSAADAPQLRFAANTDTTVIDDRLVVLGSRWRYLQPKGFEYASIQLEYYNKMDLIQATDRGEQVLDLTGGFGDDDMWGGRVQDGSFPDGS